MTNSTVDQTNQPTKSVAHALDVLFEPLNKSDAPGLTVGIAHRGRTIYRRGFGLASVELAVANTPPTRMRIGSTSKHFTSLAALLLVEDGKLDLDEGIRKYFPELPLLAGEPTVKQLMDHTSGYRSYVDVSFLSDGMAVLPKGAPLATILRQRDVNFPPGQKLIYNNTGYHLLSLLIERVSGISFELFLKTRVLDPVGMDDTESVQSDFEIKRGMATLHVPQENGAWKRGIFPSEQILGEGAMISTVDDMLRWLAHMRGSKLVGSEQTWAQLMSPTRLKNGVVNPYSLGLMLSLYRGVETIHHAGGVIGGASEMLTVPSHELDVVVLANSGAVNPAALARKAVDAVLGDDVLSAPDPKASSEKFKILVGRHYHAPSGYMFGFADVNGELGLRVMNGDPVLLKAEAQALRLDPFEDGAGGPYSIETSDFEDRVPDSLRMIEGGNAETAQLLPEIPPSLSEVSASLVGHYRSGDLNAEAEVILQGDELLLKIFGEYRTNVMKLEAFSHDVLGWTMTDDTPGRGVLSVERTATAVTAFRLDAPRTRHILFERLAA